MTKMYITADVTIGNHVASHGDDTTCRELAFSAVRDLFINRLYVSLCVNGHKAYSLLSAEYDRQCKISSRFSWIDGYLYRVALHDAVIKSPIKANIGVFFSRTHQCSDIDSVADTIKMYNTVTVTSCSDQGSWLARDGILLSGDIMIFPAFFWAVKQYRGDEWEWGSSSITTHEAMNNMSADERLFVTKLMLVGNNGPVDTMSYYHKKYALISCLDRIKIYTDAIEAAGGIRPEDIL